MNRALSHALGAAACLMLVLSAPSGAQEASDLDSLNAQLDRARADIERIQGKAKTVEDRIASLDKEAEAVARALAAAEALVEAIQIDIGVLELRIRDNELLYRDFQARATQTAIDLYKAGPAANLDVLLGARDIGELMSIIEYSSNAAAENTELMIETARLGAQLESDEAALEIKLAEAQEARGEREAQAQHLAELRRAQAMKLAELKKEIRGVEAEVAALAARSAAITNQLAGLPGTVSVGGSSALGFAWPMRGTVTSGFGPRWGSYHEGIDIDCVTGDPIGSSKAGTVLSATYDSGGYGYYVVVDHGGGYATLYGHAVELYVGAGESVAQGQTLAACGSTGHSTGDHLHFEVRVNGVPQNPLNYLP